MLLVVPSPETTALANIAEGNAQLSLEPNPRITRYKIHALPLVDLATWDTIEGSKVTHLKICTET